MLSPHGRQRRLGHRNGAEEIRLELQPQLFELDIFREPRHGESRVVDQHVEPSIVAHHAVDEAWDRVKLRDIKRPNVDLRRDSAAATAWSSRSRRPRSRMVATTRNPAFASSIEVSNPKPLDAPVTRAIFSGIRMV